MYKLLIPFLTLLAGVHAAPSPVAVFGSVSTSVPYKQPLLLTIVASPGSLTGAANGGWKDLTDYGEIGDNSWDVLDDNDKKYPLFPDNTQDMSHLGQFKGLGISAYKREYSWETKDADNKAITQKCAITFVNDSDQSEVWVWADTGKVVPVKNGTLLSDEEVSEFAKQNDEHVFIKHHCD